MATFQERLRRLTRTSRGRGRLKPAASRQSIDVAISEGLPSAPETTGGGGAGNFLELSDTPLSYAGQAGKVFRVNTGENLLEFEDAVASPFTEQSRTTTSVRICCVNNPTFYIDFEVCNTITFQDAKGTEFVMNLFPDTTSNCP